jgi:hypothetical protein
MNAGSAWTHGIGKGYMMRASHVKGRSFISSWSEGDLQLDNVRIHYYRTGAKEKPPLVLLHGFSDNGLCWSEVVQDWELREKLLSQGRTFLTRPRTACSSFLNRCFPIVISYH